MNADRRTCRSRRVRGRGGGAQLYPGRIEARPVAVGAEPDDPPARSAAAAGEQLLATLGPAFGDIEARLQALGELRDQPSGSLRLTAGRHDSFLGMVHLATA